MSGFCTHEFLKIQNIKNQILQSIMYHYHKHLEKPLHFENIKNLKNTN